VENKRYDSVDIIRGIAMIMIIILHYCTNFHITGISLLDYFQMACPIFFVTSGFGIMCSINNKFDGRIDRSNIFRFYISRYKSLAPTWYSAILLTFVVNTILINLTDIPIQIGVNRDAISILCNLLFINGLLPFCNNDVMLGGWYIGTTAVLYALTPAITKMINVKHKYAFAVISSVIGMGIWFIWDYTFSASIADPNFGYYLFLVHYPEYLLGVFLYYNYKERRSSKMQIERCLPTSIIALIIAMALFFNLSIFCNRILSAWMTALAAYYALRYMLATQTSKERGQISSLLIKFGKNSYFIFLLHGFFTFPFISIALPLLKRTGVPEIVSFFVLMPVTIYLSYWAGNLFRRLIITGSPVGKPANKEGMDM